MLTYNAKVKRAFHCTFLHFIHVILSAVMLTHIMTYTLLPDDAIRTVKVLW